ncbi:MAG TPA: TRAM domain-containing protein, partial [Acidimicrobiales bacterium]|nr:TRAM domain-containing protein [Acidimicrobiales bacterium]
MTEAPRILELTVGAIAAGGGCVGRADDGRVVFVRHSLPGERVRAVVTGEAKSYLRADALTVLDPSPDRVTPPCPHAGPGRCGGCDWQHVSSAAQRRLKADLISEQLRRIAGVSVVPEVEAVDSGQGERWRTRVRFGVDESGRPGLRKHRSHEIELVDECLIATAEVEAAGVAGLDWPGCEEIE